MVSRSAEALRPSRTRRANSATLTPFTFWRRRVLVTLVVVVVLFFGYLGTTLVMYLGNPSYGISMSARAAEWGRSHGLGAVVTWVEQESYRLNPPKTGGRPPQSAFGSGSSTVNIPVSGHLPAPTRLVSPAGARLADEGVWHVSGRTTAKGIPTIYEAFVRPDPTHTSYVAGVAWMDPTVLKAQLYSGSQIPGPGSYKYTAPIKYNATKTLVAAFNAGFRMADAHGGYYTDGHIVDGLKMRNGAATAVIFKDGALKVGKWGRDFSFAKTKDIVSVRQNLNLIVDNSHVVQGLNTRDQSVWGQTLGGTAFVPRSGLGITKDGAVVYVAGPTLSITSLAHILQLAGCVRAMEMDINTDWVQYSTYRGPLGKALNGGNGHSLLSTMNGTPSRYFVPSWSRDFFTMSLR
jgi:hypothetical protein